MRRDKLCELQADLVEGARDVNVRVDGAQRPVRFHGPRLRDDECDVLAASHGHAHDVADAQLQIARIVAQGQVESRRANRSERVDRTD